MIEGVKYDGGKPKWDLLPSDALEEIVKVYTMGAVKYAPHNWAQGMSWSRVFAAMMRHAWAYWRGEDIDPESGLNHMAHVGWGALTLLAYAKRDVGLDDRFKLTKGEE